MSKEDFIKHMRELIYRIDVPAAAKALSGALTLYEADLPSLEDQGRLDKAAQLRFEAGLLEGAVRSHPPKDWAETKKKKSVDAVIEEIAHQNNGFVKKGL